MTTRNNNHKQQHTQSICDSSIIGEQQVLEARAQARIKRFQEPLAHVAAAFLSRPLDEIPYTDEELAYATLNLHVVDPNLFFNVDADKVLDCLRGVYRHYVSGYTPDDDRPAQERYQDLLQRYHELQMDHMRRDMGNNDWDKLQEYVHKSLEAEQEGKVAFGGD